MPINNIIDNELINLKLVKDRAKKENDVVIQDINTAVSDFSLALALNIE